MMSSHWKVECSPLTFPSPSPRRSKKKHQDRRYGCKKSLFFCFQRNLYVVILDHHLDGHLVSQSGLHKRRQRFPSKRCERNFPVAFVVDFKPKNHRNLTNWYPKWAGHSLDRRYIFQGPSFWGPSAVSFQGFFVLPYSPFSPCFHLRVANLIRFGPRPSFSA